MEGIERTDDKKIVTLEDYGQIIGFVNNFKGLAIDCEIEVLKNEKFSMYTVDTLKSIVGLQSTYNIRVNSRETDEKINTFINNHKDEALSSFDPKFMLNYAIKENINPVRLVRKVLLTMYKKKLVGQILKYPFQLSNDNLEANVEMCIYNDILDGPMADLRRRCQGEDYECKLKEHCNELKLLYHDEVKLRELGFDKTPDIKLIVPIMYRGHIVSWIESKATFGDKMTHKGYVQTQLSSYCNRFGSGIVIYWFGYTENTPRMDINNVGIIVLHDFPQRSDLVLMDCSQ